MIEGDRVWERLARELRPLLDSWGVGRVVEARVEGGSLVIVHRSR